MIASSLLRQDSHRLLACLYLNQSLFLGIKDEIFRHPPVLLQSEEGESPETVARLENQLYF